MLVISEYFMFNVWKILARGYCMHVFLVIINITSVLGCPCDLVLLLYCML